MVKWIELRLVNRNSSRIYQEVDQYFNVILRIMKNLFSLHVRITIACRLDESGIRLMKIGVSKFLLKYALIKPAPQAQDFVLLQFSL